MTAEEYKNIMSICGFPVKKSSLAMGLYYIAYYDNIENIKSSFALFDTDNNTVLIYKDIYYDNKIRLTNKVIVNNAKDLKEICLNIAKTYKELKIIQKKKELEKDFT